MTSFLIVVLGVHLCLLSPCFGASWTYHGETGPAYWKTLGYCNGTRQSPIDIETNEVIEVDLGAFELQGYESQNDFMDLDNNGHGVTVRLADDLYPLYQVTGGGLRGSYIATQFHFHWGSDNSRGSEHTVDGKAYPAEVHMVHYSGRYDNLVPALTSGVHDAVAVLGFFIEVGPHNNNAFDSFLDYLEYVAEYHSPSTSLGRGYLPSFSVRSIMPHDLSRFYRYNGSLTVPNCYESVLWTVFQETVMISQAQLEKFRNVYGDAHDAHGSYLHTVDNFRPTNALFERHVYHSRPAPREDDEHDHDDLVAAQDAHAHKLQADNSLNGWTQEHDIGGLMTGLMTVATIVLGSVLILTLMSLFMVAVLYLSQRSTLRRQRRADRKAREASETA